MSTGPISDRLEACIRVMAPFMRLFQDSPFSRKRDEPGVCDFAVGNPHDMPLQGFVDALQKWAVPENKDWFAYKANEPESRAVVARSLRNLRGVPFEEEDVFLTNGAFGGLVVALNTVADRGDEVIFVSPPWFFYEPMIVATGATPVRVKIDPESFDLDLDAIEGAVNERTRAIIVNSPHNPTGKIYPPDTLRGLADILSVRSERSGKPVYLLSDESYSRIVYDGRDYPSPTAFYPNSFLIYTYGKTLLTPGQRLGYIALPPTMPNREALRMPITAAQFLAGHAFPNALLQHALPDLEQLSIDVGHLEEKRDKLVWALRNIGYQVTVPEGTFYLMVRSPWEDDWAFVDLLAQHDILALPGTVVEMPRYFRLSLTANDEMIDHAIPRFGAAWNEARTEAQPHAA